ncbi:MAG: hypothetical protein ACT4QC_14455 [Planctomycetaceae bacterium]
MSETVLSVTEAARHFAEYVNRAHYQSQSFLLLKGGVPFARLVPAGPAACRGRDLAQVLEKVSLPDAERRAWQRDLKAALKYLARASHHAG